MYHKHILIGGSVIALALLITYAVGMKLATSSVEAEKPSNCATIQGGTIKDTSGNVIKIGVDKYGYNYEAHLFNGYEGNYSRPATLVASGNKLSMKWSDSWLSNVDCNNDGKLDRGLVDGIVGGVSKGWLTNHYVGSYPDGDGKEQKFTDFVKIVWVGPGGDLWGQYHLVQEIYNDTGEGNSRTKDGKPGFGLNEQWTKM